MPYAVALGTVLSFFCLFATDILLLVGIEEHIAVGAGRPAEVYGYAMPFGMIYIASMYFLEGIKRTLPGLLLMVVANILNIGLNWLLVYGNWGFSAMGAEGSAWATTVIRIVMVIGMVGYIWWMADWEKFGIRLKPKGGWRAWAEPAPARLCAGLSFGIEHGAFTCFFLFAGLMGEITIAAMNITFVVFGFFFMVAAGISSATGVQVGDAYGRRDARDIRFSGWTGMWFTGAVLIVPSLILIFAPRTLGAMFSDDAVVIAAAVPLYMLSAGAMILDGVQTVLANALRGRHDKWFPTMSHTVSYIVLMVPLSALLAFSFDRGAEGLMEAFIIASVVSVALLATRFAWLAREDRRRGFIVAPKDAEPPGHSLEPEVQPDRIASSNVAFIRSLRVLSATLGMALDRFAAT